MIRQKKQEGQDRKRKMLLREAQREEQSMVWKQSCRGKRHTEGLSRPEN